MIKKRKKKRSQIVLFGFGEFEFGVFKLNWQNMKIESKDKLIYIMIIIAM